MLGRPKALIIDGAIEGLDKLNRDLLMKLLKTATQDWGSAVLVGVSVLTEELASQSTACVTENSEGGWTVV